ncbi:hypothetical protein H6G11_15630 [Cyanobacterium aponinum FACHB-4101]|uniref:hypothetical protein n=1 Tax=Cyanobacterium aponinum TaxID=379064 RepID=UPI0016813B06|nr:hypothetical protein [Cyanobacterium aponinum]MBD2395675.1 hypothetical protein [Cyanobacterium aponinum FACHB-4101]
MSKKPVDVCWYCECEKFTLHGVEHKLIQHKGKLWHPNCLGGYLRVNRYRRSMANRKPFQPTLLEQLKGNRKPRGIKKYERAST